jgi:hypothetical protein
MHEARIILARRVAEGETELHMDKLPDLLDLNCGPLPDAVRELGSASEIRNTFRGFQRQLYNAGEGGEARVRTVIFPGLGATLGATIELSVLFLCNFRLIES